MSHHKVFILLLFLILFQLNMSGDACYKNMDKMCVPEYDFNWKYVKIWISWQNDRSTDLSFCIVYHGQNHIYLIYEDDGKFQNWVKGDRVLRPITLSLAIETPLVSKCGCGKGIRTEYGRLLLTLSRKILPNI